MTKSKPMPPRWKSVDHAVDSILAKMRKASEASALADGGSEREVANLLAMVDGFYADNRDALRREIEAALVTSGVLVTLPSPSGLVH